MGSYAELWISNEKSPVAEQEPVDGILSKWYVPLGWLALFEPKDFILETQYEEKEDKNYHVLFSSKPVREAINLIQQRSDYCSQLGGESWAKGLEFFLAFLTNGNASYVHVEYSGLADDDFLPIYQREFYIKQLSNMAHPPVVEKRSLFGGKKEELSEHWKMMTPEEFKIGKVLPYWAWFGAPPGTKEDWDA